MKCLPIFPISTFISIIIAFLFNFLSDILDGHVKLLLFPCYCDHPGILAEFRPAIIGELLTIGSITLSFSMYLKHRQLMEYFSDTKYRRTKILNTSRCIMIIGIIIPIGLTIVANFRDGSIIGIRTMVIFILFVIGLIYIWCITILGFLLPRAIMPKKLAYWRLFLAILSFLFLVTSLVYAFDWYKKDMIFKKIIIPDACAKKTEILYYISAAGECGLVLSFGLFLLTITYDLSGSDLLSPRMNVPSTEQIQTPFLDSYRLEYLSNSNLHTATPRSKPSPKTNQTIISNQVQAISFYEYETDQADNMEKVSRNSYQTSSTGLDLNADMQQQKRTSAFSYTPDMPNPFNAVGHLKKVYMTD